MERGSIWKDRNALQKMIDRASLCDRDERGKAVSWKDESGSGASVALLKGVLNALLTFYPNMYPSEAMIAARSGRGLRSVERAVAILLKKDIIAIADSGEERRGGRINRYSILSTKLAQLGLQQGSLWNQRTTRHVGNDLPPPGRDLPPGGQRPTATGGGLTINQRTREDQTKQGRAREMLRVGKGEVLRLANEVRHATGDLTQEEADEVIDLCILRADSQISENAWSISLKSTAKAKPRDGFAYWKTCVRNQLAEVGVDLEDLMIAGAFR